MAFNAQWKPGPDAAAGMHQIGSDMATLVIYMDPDSLALMPPADPAKWPAFVGLLRQLRDGAQEVADFLEGQRQSAIEQEAGVSLELPGLTNRPQTVSRETADALDSPSGPESRDGAGR